MRRTVLCLLAIVTVLGGWTCRGTQWEFNRRTFRFERMGSRQSAVRPVAKSNERQAAVEPIEPETAMALQTVKKPAPTPAKRQIADDYADLGLTRHVRLYMVQGTNNRGLPKENVYNVMNAPLEKLSDVLSLLYPGEPGGGSSIRLVVYTNSVICQYAMQFASRLDVAAGSNDAWGKALTELYASQFPRKLDPQRRFRIVNLLNQVAGSADRDRQLQWSARILVAHLSEHYDPKDYIVAGHALSEAQSLVSGVGFQAMVTEYHRLRHIKARRGNGSSLASAKFAEQTRRALEDYRAWKNTACYQKIKLLAPPAGKFGAYRRGGAESSEN